MNEQALIDLVQAGIDGELDDAGQAELDRLLATSEEARRVHGELAAVSRWLDQAEPVEPPADLHARIVGAIELPAPKRRWFRFGQNDSRSPLGYGLAAAAGVVLTLAVVGQRDASIGPGNAQNMAGTMAPSTRDVEIGVSRFEYNDGEGELLLTRKADGYRLDVVLNGSAPVDWRLDLGGSGLVLDSLASQVGTPVRVDWRDGEISGEGDASVRWTAGLQLADGAEALNVGAIGLRLDRAGEILHQGQLQPGGD